MNRAPIQALAERLRAVAVNALPGLLTAAKDLSDDPLAGLCGFAAVGAVHAAAAMGYGGKVVPGRYHGFRHYWARLDCGLDLDITGPQFHLPPVLVVSKAEARRLGYRWSAGGEIGAHDVDIRGYARRYGCRWFPADWWRAAVRGEVVAA